MPQTTTTNRKFREELANILLGLAGNFGDTFDAPTLEMWHKMVKTDGFSLEQVRQAAVEIMRTRTIAKMPTYAEFVEYIQGSAKDQAAVQADIVIEMLDRVGATRQPEFSDPITAHLMSKLWKWKRWASKVKEDELKWWRRDFIEAYHTYSRIGIEKSPQIEAGADVKRLSAGIGQEST